MKTTEEFVKQAKKVHKNDLNEIIYDFVEYKGNHKKVKLFCSKHGEFWQTPASHLQGRGCPKCSKQSYAYTTEEFIEKAMEIHKNDDIPTIYDKVNYINGLTEVCLICPVHGEYYQTPRNHLKGCKCPQCGRRNKPYSTEEFIEIAKQIHSNDLNEQIYDLVDYKNIRTKIKIICSKHGEYEQTPFDHLQGKGCPKCNSSHLESETMEILNNLQLEYTYQFKTDWLKNKNKLSIDFYIPKLELGLECQGKQHYHPIEKFGGIDYLNEVKNRDIIKNNLCSEHGLKLIYIFNDDVDFNTINSSIYNDTNSIKMSNLRLFLDDLRHFYHEETNNIKLYTKGS